MLIVLLNVDIFMNIMYEEIFGLVVLIVMFLDIDEVIKFVNDMLFGFVVYFFIENYCCGIYIFE